jgi:diaminopimelate decarboxylase
MGSNALGLDHWWRLFSQMLVSAQAIETTSGRHISCLDLGGGWYPDDWADELSPRFEERVIQQVTRALPHVRELFLEPGRMLAQSSMALAVRVLEVRRGADGRIGDVVVDGSIAELAYHNYTIFPHRILWRDPVEQRWRPVGRGQARILGRLCMEKDILAEAVDVPDSLAVGDLFAFCDAGAYDRSMSYSFGQG